LGDNFGEKTVHGRGTPNYVEYFEADLARRGVAPLILHVQRRALHVARPILCRFLTILGRIFQQISAYFTDFQFFSTTIFTT